MSERKHTALMKLRGLEIKPIHYDYTPLEEF